MNDQNNGQGKFSGQGGSYLVGADGEHKLVARTRNPGDPEPESAAPLADPPTLTEVAAQQEPAQAGFSLPVAPAEQPTAE